MANIKEIIGEEAFNALSEEKRKELGKKDFEDVSNGAFVSKKKLEDANKIASDYKKQVGDRDKQLIDLKKEYKDVDGLKEKVETLEKANQDQKENHEKELVEIAFGNALEGAMGKYEFQDGAKELILSQIKGSVKFEDGKLIGFTEAMTDIEKNKAYLLKSTPIGTGSFETGGDPVRKESTKEDIAVILGKQQAENMKGNSGFDKFIAK